MASVFNLILLSLISLLLPILLGLNWMDTSLHPGRKLHRYIIAYINFSLDPYMTVLYPITLGLNIPYVCARSVHGLRSVHRACTVRKGCTDPKLYMFLESA